MAVKSLASYPGFSPSTAPSRSGLEHEATILSLLGRHPNIVEFYGLSRQGGGLGGEWDCERVHIVTKLAEGGSIADALGIKEPWGRGTDGHGTNGRGINGRRTNSGANGWGLNGRGREQFDGSVRAGWARDLAKG